MRWLVCPTIWLLFLSLGLADVHVVKKGDTLYGIGRRYGIAVSEILAANAGSLSEKSILRIGQKIRLPAKTNAEAAAPAAAGGPLDDRDEKPEEEAEPPEGPPAPQPDEVVRDTPAAESDRAATGLLVSHRPPPVPPVPPPPDLVQAYRVQRGDTLYKIARRFGMSVDQLRKLNDLTSDLLQVGQSLAVTGAAAASQAAPPERKPRYLFIEGILDQLEAAPVKPGRWKNIVAHHSGTATGNARIFEYFHRNIRGMENGMAYHFVIGNGRDSEDGGIEVGSRWTKQLQGGHLASDDLNDVSLGICFVGDFNRSRPTKRQIAAAIELISYLRTRCGGEPPAFSAHREINPKPTECPGKLFPVNVFHELFE